MVSEFKKKQKSKTSHKKILYIFYITISLVVIYFLSFANIEIYQKKQELKKQLESLERQIQDLNKNNNALQDKIQNVSNSDFIEKIAREELGLQKDNENTAVFLTPKFEEKKLNDQTQSKNWFTKIWQSIINIFK